MSSQITPVYVSCCAVVTEGLESFLASLSNIHLVDNHELATVVITNDDVTVEKTQRWCNDTGKTKKILFIHDRGKPTPKNTTPTLLGMISAVF